MTKIEWTRGDDGSEGLSWNAFRAERVIKRKGKPVTVSANHCEHVNEACRFCYADRMNLRLGGLPFKPGHRKDYRFFVDRDKLTMPLRRKKPTRIFVESMSDAFGEWWPTEFIDQLYAVMALTPQHTYINLSKRPERRRQYLASDSHERMLEAARLLTQNMADALRDRPLINWPLPNVIEGTSVSCQEEADEFREIMRDTRATLRVVSYEPALGPVDWAGWEFLSWLISGGESGPKARPSHPAWHRATRDFCAAHDIAYHFKQWGEWVPSAEIGFAGYEHKPTRTMVPYEMMRVGKKAAGRLLDGREWNQFPAAGRAASLKTAE